MLGYALFLAFIGDEGVKRVRFMAEISLAKKLHEALVPAVDASVGGLTVYGKSLPSDEVGGDLLDFWSGGDTISVYLADVSGHGVTAGAMMGMTKSAIRVQLTTGQPLDRLLETLNDVLVDLTPTNMFLTLVSVRFRPDCVEVCSAGHLPVLRHMKESEKIARIHSRQIPIGVLKNTGYCCSLVPRTQGDLFVLMTDGLTEVRNSAGDMFGLERIEEIILRMPDAALPEIYQAIMEAIWAFGKQEDDQTLLLVRT
jgi:serine phosphatase RsbU (regulator of sigma subunit)